MNGYILDYNSVRTEGALWCLARTVKCLPVREVKQWLEDNHIDHWYTVDLILDLALSGVDTLLPPDTPIPMDKTRHCHFYRSSVIVPRENDRLLLRLNFPAMLPDFEVPLSDETWTPTANC